MSVSSGYLKNIGYLFFVFIITAFWDCGGESSKGGGEDVVGRDIITRDIQIPNDSAVQDIQSDIEFRDEEDIKDIIESGDIGEDIEVGVEIDSDITDTSEDISDTKYSDVIEDISDVVIRDAVVDTFDDIKDVLEDIQDISDCKISDPKHLWSKSFGGSNYDEGYSVSVDSSGNVYITGYFRSSTIDFGGGALTNSNHPYSDIFLAKFDNNGNHLWSKSFVYGTGYSVSADGSGNVYGTGSFSGNKIDFGGCPLPSIEGSLDIYLIKYAP